MSRLSWRYWRSDRGAAAVEFALVAILLMIMVVSIVQFAMLMQAKLAVTHAAREGARQVAVTNVLNTAYVREQARPLNVTVTRLPDGTDSLGNKFVQVRVSYQFDYWFLNTNWTRSFRSEVISSTAQMRAEF